MAQQILDRRDLDFVLWEQMDCEEILNNENYQDFNRKTCDMIVKEARALAIKEVLPTMADGDREEVKFDKGAVTVPESFHRPFELILEGEWQNLSMPTEMGGQGAPEFIGAAAAQYMMGANWALHTYATMGNGTAGLIALYGTQEQKDLYIEKLTSAQWGGTMLLTESEAGSDVGALTTTAVENPDGTYTLTGNKIFITNGEHDLVENIIHPVLARIEGDPPGTKGISIFLVPKFFTNSDGSLGERNDIVCTGVEEKHGIRGSATCTMALGSNCIGYLLGEKRKGMRIMFNMINHARMGVGLQGLTYASAAYLLAVNYARERIQGRALENFADASAPSVSIINHPDVRRNLLWMKSYVNGMQSFYYYMTKLSTNAELAATEEERELNENLFNMLTPVVKDFMSVKGHEVCIQAIQVYGGAGYSHDYLVEQYARDCKIGSIYEGTSGIQAMDLLARKIGMKNGMVFMNFMGEIQKTVAQAKEIEILKGLAEKVEQATNKLGETAMHIGQAAMSEKFKTAFAHSLPFLYALADTVMAWMLLWRAVEAQNKLSGGPKKKDVDFYEGQSITAEFFIETVLPEALGRMKAIKGSSDAAIKMPDAAYGGL